MTATQHVYSSLEVTTNAQGEAVFSVWPYQQSDKALIGNSSATLNLSSFNPRQYNSSAPGAYNVTQNAIKYRVVSASMRFRYTGPSITAQGTRAGAFLPTMVTKDSTYGVEMLKRQPISDVAMVQTEFRVIWIPQDPADLNFTFLNPRDSGAMAVVFQGCTPSTTIGVVESWINLEYVPDEGYLNVVSQQRSQEPSSRVEQMDRLVSENPNIMTAAT